MQPRTVYAFDRLVCQLRFCIFQLDKSKPAEAYERKSYFHEVLLFQKRLNIYIMDDPSRIVDDAVSIRMIMIGRCMLMLDVGHWTLAVRC